MRAHLLSLARTLISFTAVAALAACGSSTGSSTDDPSHPAADNSPIARTGGTFSALPLDFKEGAAFITPASDTTGGVKSELHVFVSDRPGMCGASPRKANETLFVIDALSGDDTFGPGTFTQTQSNVAGQVDVSVTKLNATCGADGDYGASAATVIVTSVTATKVDGTFDVTFLSSGQTLKGTFSVPICNQASSDACEP